MTRLGLAVVMLALSAVTASAADLAARPGTKAPPLAVAATDWSGVYIGGNGGGGWGRTCFDVNTFAIDLLGLPLTVTGPEGCHTASGATAGGQIGYRWQSAAWVFGVEAQGNWADLSGSNRSQLPFFDGFANRTRIDAIGLFTGQVGMTWDSVLVYVKGGAAVAHDKYEGFLTAPLGPLPTGFISNRGSESRWGGVVGVGAEFAFMRNWSFGVEYDHLFMGDRDVSMTYDPAFVAALNHSERIRQDVDLVTARINYRFGGPVVAKD